MTSSRPTPRKAGQHHGDLRRALLDAALRLVQDRDPDAISLRAVAREAGVSSGAPYHHFEDKDALLAAVALEGFLALAAEQRSVKADHPVAFLEALTSRYVRFAIAHRTHYAVMFRRSPTRIDQVSGAGLREAAMATFGTLLEAIRSANPRLHPDAVMERGLMAWSLAHGAVSVSPWVHDLAPALSADAIADGVGRATVALVMADPRC